jgi:dipeptidyl aminopeptidase/acylaminoacyl peptidase
VRIGIERLDTKFRVIHRADPQADWEPLYEFTWNNQMLPLGFDKEDRTLLVGWTGDDETEGLYTYDIAAKKIGQLAFRHQQADFDALVFSTTRKSLVGVTFETDRPQTIWFDPSYRRLQASVDRVLTNTLNRLVNTSIDETRALFLTSSDRDPGSYYFLDTTAPGIEELFDRASGVPPREMALMTPIEYKARDGLQIHGYLTLPNGQSNNLPMVVMPHGGPSARDSWGYNPDTQFLANRGYAVLQMNFRGSTGYGQKFLEAGFRPWGLKQQDDITDGVKWAIAQGMADPRRIAIFGSSYGGFAALVGLEQTPELYRCGVCYAGVTDIVRTFQTLVSFGERSDLRLNRLMLAETVGDVRKDKERLSAISPLRNAHLVQAPVFLAYGELDPRVPISTGHDMANALRARGKLSEFMVKADEGHGFVHEENRIEFWTKVEAFLKKNLK